MNLQGKNVVHVGGFGGIGFGTCKVLMQRNVANLIILNRTERPDLLVELHAINERVQLHYVYYEMTDSDEQMALVWAGIYDKFKRIDVLINGAAIFNDHEVELSIRVNLLGLINTTIAAMKFMDKSKGGKGGLVVNVSSVAGLDPFPTVPIYSTTKAGIIAFTRSISQLQPVTGISAICVCPGLTRTKMMAHMPTFMNIDPHLTEKANSAPVQSSEECGANIVDAIELNQNGTIWLLDCGKMQLCEMPKYWDVPKEMLA